MTTDAFGNEDQKRQTELRDFFKMGNSLGLWKYVVRGGLTHCTAQSRTSICGKKLSGGDFRSHIKGNETPCPECFEKVESVVTYKTLQEIS